MSLKRIGGKAIVYALSNGLGSAAQLLLLFYCAYVLPGDSLGVLTLFTAVVALSTQVMGFGLVAAFQRDFYTASSDLRRAYLSTLVGAVIVVGLIILLLVSAAVPLLGDRLGFPASLLIVAMIGALGQALQQFLLAVWQSEGAGRSYLIYMSCFCALQMVVPMGVIEWLGHRWESAVYGQAAVFLLAGLLSLGVLRVKGYLRPCCHRSYLRSALSFGLPLVPYQFAGWGMAMLDRFIITSFSGVAVAGYYALAFQAAQLINIVSSGFNQAFSPWLYASLSKGTAGDFRQIRLVLSGYSAGLVLICLSGYLLFAMIAGLLDNQAYREALVFAPWLFLAMLLNGLYRASSSFLLYNGRTGVLAIMISLIALVSVGLNYELVQIWGAPAAGWVCCLCFGLLFSLTAFLAVNQQRVR
ncbi:lipopolysaccharide biosynthesis protein [Pseudomonas farsensis]|uniref:Oligosaccharide flippase family protein n=1 Tax=Pseudomonas farsensis TaxID=2745492 RepID=A0ABU8QU36_9PSED